MPMKYIKTESLPRMDDPVLNRALEQLDEELNRIARVFIDWTDATQDFKTSGTLTLPNVGLHLLDTNASHDLIIKPGSDLTVDRILTLTTGNAARTITLSGDPTLADWFDQAVKQASSPTFVTAKLSALTDGYVPYHIDDATGLANSPIFTDGTNVGIGTASPNAKLSFGTNLSKVALYDDGSSFIGIESFASGLRVGTYGSAHLIEFGHYSTNGTFVALNVMQGGGNVGIGLTPTANMLGLAIEAGLLTLKERATPTADANYGKIYTKNDNKLYFQDGAGTEHEIAYAV